MYESAKTGKDTGCAPHVNPSDLALQEATAVPDIRVILAVFWRRSGVVGRPKPGWVSSGRELQGLQVDSELQSDIPALLSIELSLSRETVVGNEGRPQARPCLPGEGHPELG